MSDELFESGEGSKRTSAWSLLRGRSALRAAGVLCAGLAQGIVIFLMSRSSQQWHWYITAFMLPAPFYLAREASKRAAAALIPWGALMILLDASRILFKNPYANWQDVTISTMACAGALMALPNFVSWIDGEGALPEWRISFQHLSRVFFSSIIAGIFLLLFFTVLGIGGGLVSMIGIRIHLWSGGIFVIMACAVWGVVFHWTANARVLLDVLERYVLALFSCLMPFLSVFTLAFAAALPMGIDRLWKRGFSSGVILGILLASGLCAFAAWQGGVMDGGRPREPFPRPLNILTKAALVPLPIFCPLLVYTIGLRVEQYNWTVDRAVSMFLAAAFGLWSLAWAFFLVKSWRSWPFFYGRVNRIAFPVVGAALILLSSPICDIRRIVLNERFEWLRESVRTGGDVGEFDWRYVASRLGVYGVRAMEELEAGGSAKIHEKFGPFETDSQAVKIQDEISGKLASVKKAASHGARERKITSEDFILSARSAPVFGGELDPGERERMARRFTESFAMRRVWEYDDKVGFFYLEDMDGDGEKDVLLGQRDKIYLFIEDRVLQLKEWHTAYRASGGRTNNETAISADEQRIIRYRWNMLQINGRVFFVDPGDAAINEPATDTPED